MQVKAFVFIGLCFGSPMITAAEQGKTLHDAVCLQCHASLGGGDPYQMYQRNDRKVNTLAELKTQVQTCAMAAGANWTPAQQAAVVDFLRQRFYSFSAD